MLLGWQILGHIHLSSDYQAALTQQDLHALAQVCTPLYSIFNPLLYRVHIPTTTALDPVDALMSKLKRLEQQGWCFPVEWGNTWVELGHENCKNHMRVSWDRTHGLVPFKQRRRWIACTIESLQRCRETRRVRFEFTSRGTTRVFVGETGPALAISADLSGLLATMLFAACSTGIIDVTLIMSTNCYYYNKASHLGYAPFPHGFGWRPDWRMHDERQQLEWHIRSNCAEFCALLDTLPGDLGPIFRALTTKDPVTPHDFLQCFPRLLGNGGNRNRAMYETLVYDYYLTARGDSGVFRVPRRLHSACWQWMFLLYHFAQIDTPMSRATLPYVQNIPILGTYSELAYLDTPALVVRLCPRYAIELLERMPLPWDPNFRDHSERPALFDACHHGNLELVRYLLAHGAEVNARDDVYGHTPIMEHMWRLMDQYDNPDFELFDFLVQRCGASLDFVMGERRDTILHAAVQAALVSNSEHPLAIVRHLLSYDQVARLPKYNAFMFTPLHRLLSSTDRFRQELLVLLLQHMTAEEVNQPDTIHHRTALFFALVNPSYTAEHKLWTCRRLLEAGATLANEGGWYTNGGYGPVPTLWAAHGSVQVTRLLLQRGGGDVVPAMARATLWGTPGVFNEYVAHGTHEGPRLLMYVGCYLIRQIVQWGDGVERAWLRLRQWVEQVGLRFGPSTLPLDVNMGMVLRREVGAGTYKLELLLESLPELGDHEMLQQLYHYVCHYSR